MKPSQDCIDLIEEFEGTHLKAYRDPGTGGEPITIGKGSTVYRNAGLAKYGRTKVRLGDTLTLEQANQEFAAFLQIIASRINATKAKLTQSQFDAVTSFCYNAGFPEPQMRRLRDGNLDDFYRFMARYIDEGTSVEAGLRRRRKAEQALWNKDKKPMQQKVTWIALTKRGNDNVLRGMAGPLQTAEHTWTTKAELIALLQRYVDAGTAQVTAENWEPEGKAPETAPQSVATLVRTGKKEPGGCEELKLTLGDQVFICRSGQPWAQVFQPGGATSVPGSMMPLPGGDYSIGPIEFAGGKDNYSASFGEGLGPCWVGLEPRFKTRRSAFGAHLDSGAYGTAGCLGFRNVDELKSFVAALRKFDPKVLRVAW